MQAVGCQQVPFIWFWPEWATGCLILSRRGFMEETDRSDSSKKKGLVSTVPIQII